MQLKKLKILKEINKALKLIIEDDGKEISHYGIADPEDFWTRQIEIEEKYEKRLIKILVSIFNRQEKETLRKLGKQVIKQKEFDIKINIPFLLLNLKKENKKMAVAVTPLLSEDIMETGQYALDEIGVPMTFTESTAVASYLDKYPIKFAKSVNKTTNNRLKKQLVEGISKGEGIPEISKRVKNIFKSATDNRTKTIARSEVSRATNFATVEGYKQSGVVEAKEWLTAFDERTCSFCADMNGKIVGLSDNYFEQGDEYKVGDSKLNLDYDDVGEPPLHASCRCTIIPVIK